MNRRLKASPSAPIQLRAQLLSFAYTNSSSPFQSAYWTNKNTLCYNWCVDTLGSSLWNMLLKFWSSDLRLICLVYPCLITVSVDAKVDLQTQRANTRNRYPKRASRFDLLIDKDEDTSTLVLTTAIRPEVMAKRYSRGTRGSPKIALEQCNSPNR
jgi:hypothetical protein